MRGWFGRAAFRERDGWRVISGGMCFGLFIASGSFLIGQMKFIPEPIRIVPLIVVLAISPLVMLLYWMWRVRLKQNLRGMMTANPIEARRPA